MKVAGILLAVVLIFGMLTGCGTAPQTEGDTILATTYPMYYLANRLLEGVEGVTVEVMISEPVSCLHDFTLTTEQMKKIDRADLIVMNGAGLEDFMESALETVPEENIVDCGARKDEEHYWLHPLAYDSAATTLADVLYKRYPKQYKQIVYNHNTLSRELSALWEELREELKNLSCREMVTFHDGFSDFAAFLELNIAAAIEEEEGAEAPASELKEICQLIEDQKIPAIFVEKNGSTNAAEIIASETGVKVFILNTIIDGETDYFTAMRENVRAVKEALG